jgi:iron(III) transport system ATP-binding protein
MTVARNVAYGLECRNWPRDAIAERVREMLALVHLREHAEKYPHQLSGGQQQRIALARALATSPGLLLLDEPLSALDALERVRLRQEIRALQQKVGVTTVMVTHDQEEALSVADRIVVMNQGVIEQIGTPLAIYREPASPFVADFVGKVNVLPARVTGGELRFGSLCIPCDGADRDARVYLRPEDVLARPIADGDPHVFDAKIEKIEFLGSYCHVRVASPALDANKLTVYLSLNYLSEQSLAEGSPLRLKLLPERIKVF